MRNFLKEYFNFSSTERNGIIVLISLILILIIFWKVIPFINHQPNKHDIAAFEKEIMDFENSVILKDSLKEITGDSESGKYFQFNPNTLADSGWFALGFKEYQVKTIKHFLEKGGRFRSPADFQKMYCLKQGQFEALEPYISIPVQNKLLTSAIETEKKKFILHEFDPNCTSADEWEGLGLSLKQINVIGNFIAKGGKFRTKEDFKKMYCIRPQLYDNLEPYISIAPEPTKIPKYDPNIKVDINKADSSEFRKIKGISPYLARSIVKYRNALGGFIRKEQILEVWGFKRDTYASIEKNIILPENKVIKLNLNTATFAELLKHPYLNYCFTKNIIQFRKIIGKIKNLQELQTNNVLPDSIISKIRPYFFFE